MADNKISGATHVETRRNQRGEATYFAFEVYHHGLHEVRTIGDRSHDTAVDKVNAQLRKWDAKWQATLEQQKNKEAKWGRKQTAESETLKAREELAQIENVLSHGVLHPVKINWHSLEDHRPFIFSKTDNYPLVEFDQGGAPLGAKAFLSPKAPDAQDQKYQPAFTLLDRLWPPSRARRVAQASETFELDVSQWKAAEAQAQEQRDQASEMFMQALSEYHRDKEAFIAEQTAANAEVERFKTAYSQRDPEATRRYCQLVLNASIYPAFVAPSFEVGFSGSNAMAVIECELPDKGAMPTLEKVSFSASSGERVEKHVNDRERDRLYDALLYQTSLRALFELFRTDVAAALKAVVFNGWVDALNPATGKREHGCILSVQATKEEFEGIDLAQVEARACFRKLKGVSAAKLSGMTPVRPILQLQTDDPRFVSAHAVVDSIEQGYNLATMDWEDFEHLVRELFEKEFARNGAEVHVTRASSDGGVDAIVLDPDPIRGGKIVIQAKRYTNVVGLSAVRDLYGTVINEGANRGILVTTADYGADSYEFVKGKPLSLLNGSNLLNLLEKHGRKARIDLREAKIINALNDSVTHGRRGAAPVPEFKK